MKAMIFAAGLGTRMQPYTSSIPKALVEVNGTPLLEILLCKLKIAGFTEVVVNVHHFAGQVVDFLRQKNNFGLTIHVSDETNLLLDTGGGLKKAASFFNDGQPWLVHNVDIITDLDLAAFYCAMPADVVALLLTSERLSSRYFLFDEHNRLCGWENRKTGEKKLPVVTSSPLKPLAFGGIHVVSPRAFKYFNEWSDKFSIVDFYLSIAAREDIMAYAAPENLKWVDVGKPEMIAYAEELFGNYP